jgi:hypothetical protein
MNTHPVNSPKTLLALILAAALGGICPGLASARRGVLAFNWNTLNRQQWHRSSFFRRGSRTKILWQKIR